MKHISIISSYASLYFQYYPAINDLTTSEILDLKVYNFPIFKGTLKTQKHPFGGALDFAKRIKFSDGIIIV